MPPTNKSTKRRSSKSRKRDECGPVPPLQEISLEDKQSQSAGTLSSTVSSDDSNSQHDSSPQGGSLTESILEEVATTSPPDLNPKMDVEDISPRAADGILPQLPPTTIPKTTNPWWIQKPPQEDATIPLPKNFLELAAFKQMNIDFTNRSDDRYKNLGRNKLEETIFEPLVQPTDFSRVDKNNRFLTSDSFFTP